MRIEINDVREIKEISILENGEIHYTFPDYPGHIVKLVVLNSKSKKMGSIDNTILDDTEEDLNSKVDLNYIDGTRHSKGVPKSRRTAKEFANLIQRQMTVVNRTLSWAFLSSGIQIKYMNSVVYEKMDGYELWYSFSAEELNLSLKEGPVIFAFLVRGSRNMIYLIAQDIINDINKAKEMRDNNDWTHLMIILRNNKMYIRLKTGKDNIPIEKEISRNDHYVSWSDFITIMEGVT